MTMKFVTSGPYLRRCLFISRSFGVTTANRVAYVDGVDRTIPFARALQFQNASPLKCQFAKFHHLSRCLHPVASVEHSQWPSIHSRKLWGWLNSIFNRYDSDRAKEVGPDRACAEWLLRCGAAVRWTTHKHFVKDYNSLPVGGPRLAIAEVDGTDSAIMSIGFEHFRGCKQISRVVLHKASYVDDDALRELRYLTKSLKELQVSSCGSVSAEGIKQLAHLKNLQYLLLFDFPFIDNKDELTAYLTEQLPDCAVVFTYANEKDYENMRAEDAAKELLEKEKEDDVKGGKT